MSGGGRSADVEIACVRPMLGVSRQASVRGDSPWNAEFNTLPASKTMASKAKSQQPVSESGASAGEESGLCR